PAHCGRLVKAILRRHAYSGCRTMTGADAVQPQTEGLMTRFDDLVRRIHPGLPYGRTRRIRKCIDFGVEDCVNSPRGNRRPGAPQARDSPTLCDRMTQAVRPGFHRKPRDGRFSPLRSALSPLVAPTPTPHTANSGHVSAGCQCAPVPGGVCSDTKLPLPGGQPEVCPADGKTPKVPGRP